MSMTSDGFIKYPELPTRTDVCKLSDHAYDSLVYQVSDDASSSSVETFVQDEHVSSRARIAFRVGSDDVLRVKVGRSEHQIESVSDLPGTDRVLRPSNSLKLSSRQVRVYKKWSQLLMTGQVYFTGPFACVNRITGASPEFQAQVEADRPVPIHIDEIPNGLLGFKVRSLGLSRSIGRRIYHVSNSGDVNLGEVNNEVIYLGSGRLRSVYFESDSSSDDDYMGEGEDEEVADDICDCENLVLRYREVAAKYNLEAFADQVLRDGLQHQAKNSSIEDVERRTVLHACRKYPFTGFMEVAETFRFEALLRPKPNTSHRGRWVYRIAATRLRDLVDFDAKVCNGEYEVIRIDVPRRYMTTRRDVRKVREICRLASCVCDIARKSQLSIQEVHRLFLKVPGSHTNHVFGACYAHRRGVYSGERTESEPGCICLENALRLRDVVGVICNQFGTPIRETRSGLFPVIEARNGYAHICSWTKEDTMLPSGVDLDTKIAGIIRP